MKFFLFSMAVIAGIFGMAAFSAGTEEPGNDACAVSFEVFGYPYFVRNTVVPPEGASSLALAIDSLDVFDETFGVGMVMGTKPKFLEKEYFKTHEAAVLILWGDTPWEFTVRSAVKRDRRLVVKAEKSGTPSKTAFFASPLILGFEREQIAGVEQIVFEFVKADGSDDAGPDESYSTDR